MEKEKLAQLAEKYLNGTATRQEQDLLHQWYDDWADEDETIQTEGQTEENIRASILNRIRQQMRFEAQSLPVTPLVRRKWFRYSAAASIVFIMGMAAWSLFFRTNQVDEPAENPVAAHRFKNDIAPGQEGAILTLADGTQIVLDSASNGLLASQSNAQVIKKDGRLIYNMGNGGEVVYNTMTTPHGRQYSLVLADGSKVWLNALSSITFPVAFTGNERKVTITGEAYFEIAPSNSPGGGGKKRPFIVESNSTIIEVLGTHFNVNAYPGEDAVKTTLLEGKVKVVNRESSIGNRQSAILKPGQQAAISYQSPKSHPITVQTVDVEEVVAWKNGKFAFSNASLETIMRQITAWYDVEVVFEERITDSYTVSVPKNVPVSKLLQFIELSGGVHFTIEGNKVLVRK